MPGGDDVVVDDSRLRWSLGLDWNDGTRDDWYKNEIHLEESIVQDRLLNTTEKDMNNIWICDEIPGRKHLAKWLEKRDFTDHQGKSPRSLSRDTH